MSRYIRTAAYHYSKRLKHNFRSWKELNNKDIIKNLRFRDSFERDSPETKAEFQSMFKDFLQQIKQKKDIKIPERQSMRIKNPSDPLLKLLSEGSDELRNDYLDPTSKDILEDESLLKCFAKEFALHHELTGKFMSPECGFESYSADEVKKLLREQGELIFFLNKIAKKNMDARKKATRQAEFTSKRREDMIPTYRIDKMCRTLTMWRTEISKFSENPLIIDMNFDDIMSKKALSSLAFQVSVILSDNVRLPDPTRFLLTNLKQDSSLYQKFMAAKVHDFPDGYITSTDKNLIELDDIRHEDLVYLTPDAKNDMEEFDETKVYILGGLVDSGSNTSIKVTYNIAKRLGIQSVRFPLTKYLKFTGRSSRDELNLDAAFRILYTFRTTQNWVRAFRHIPRRFHQGLTENGLILAGDDEALLDWYAGTKPFHPPLDKHPRPQGSADFLGWSSHSQR